jgi:hypothetical protein
MWWIREALTMGVDWLYNGKWFGLECLTPLSTILPSGCHGHDCVVVGFTTTFAISAYHH